MLTKSNIEYLNYGWNFYTGCNHWKTGVCAVGENCWAKSLAERFHKSFEPTLHPEKLLDPLKLKKPARIGVCFTGDLFGDWVDPCQLIESHNPEIDGIFLAAAVKQIVRDAGQHQFLFLTKAPENYQKWGIFPENAWLGASICNQADLKRAFFAFRYLAGHKWLSIEPLFESLNELHYFPLILGNIQPEWVVIGGQSGRHKVMPKIEWVREIVRAADKAGIPVFLKNNAINVMLSGNCAKSTQY
jgi:protein gp37